MAQDWKLIVDDQNGFMFELTSVKQMVKRIKDPQKFNEFIEKAFQRALELAKKLTPGKGNLRKEWEASFDRDASGKMRQAVLKNNYSNPKILEYLEWGTKAHDIRPKNGGFLVFFSKLAIGRKYTVGGRDLVNTSGWVRARVVKHPGTKAYDIIGSTRRSLMAQIAQMKAGFLANLARGS